LNINISTNISQVSKALNAFGKNQIPFAASRALNDVAFHMSRKVMPKESDDTFKGGATAFTRRGFKYLVVIDFQRRDLLLCQHLILD